MIEIPYSDIVVGGNDAFEFLQAQLTSDLRRLDDEPLLLSAWCSPKGRVITMLRAHRDGDGFALSLLGELADSVVKRLTMFRFRAKVDFATRPTDPATLGIGESLSDWQLGNLHAGIVEIRSAQSEAFTPHMLNLDLIGAVSLDKGCYPGQEIVARTHYRGATKRRLQRFESRVAVTEGTEVLNGNRKVGEVVNAIGTDLLAVVPLDATADLTAGAGITLLRRPLPYLDD
ncbi:MAG: hypothetical protein R3288_09815 [Woeseiaceae bacterium]|nr:hypothetical protein [Woeseiaceae bacterium]